MDQPSRSSIAAWLANDITTRGVITTGFVGCNLILPTLTQIGRDDLAWQLLTNEKFPSWLFSVKHGATTIWERWDGWTPEKGFQDPGMNSFNHYAYGSCGQWMYARIGGIELDEQSPGYKRIIINPVLAPGLTSAPSLAPNALWTGQHQVGVNRRQVCPGRDHSGKHHRGALPAGTLH